MNKRNLLLLVVGAVLLALVVWRWLGQSSSNPGGSDRHSAADSVPVAAVARAEKSHLISSLTIAGAFKPFQDVDIHAKVAGYIKEIYVDVGSHVREGQALAILEVPELAAELTGADAAVRRAKEEIRRAQGELTRAQSFATAAHAMYDRLSQAAQQRPGLVAQQDLDDAQAKDLGGQAEVASAQAALDAAQQALQVAQADQQKYAALSDYTRITAPFAGVVTIRYADTGSLIASGTSTSTQSEPVVRLAQISVLRLVLPIPESIASGIRLGDPVKVHVQALDQDYVGTVSRFADALDEQTRTMHTEVDFQNTDGKLMPGMYVEAKVPPALDIAVLSVPVEAVEVNGVEGTVLVLGDQNVLEERKVRLGVQGSTRIEVRSGLNDGDRVVIGSRNEFRRGMKVIPKEMDTGQAGGAQ